MFDIVLSHMWHAAECTDSSSAPWQCFKDLGQGQNARRMCEAACSMSAVSKEVDFIAAFMRYLELAPHVFGQWHSFCYSTIDVKPNCIFSFHVILITSIFISVMADNCFIVINPFFPPQDEEAQKELASLCPALGLWRQHIILEMHFSCVGVWVCGCVGGCVCVVIEWLSH